MNYEPRRPWQFPADGKNVDAVPPAPLDYEARGASRQMSRGSGNALAKIGLAIFFAALGIVAGFYLALGIASGVSAAGPGPDHYTYNDYTRDGVIIVALSVLCLVVITVFMVIGGRRMRFRPFLLACFMGFVSGVALSLLFFGPCFAISPGRML